MQTVPVDACLVGGGANALGRQLATHGHQSIVERRMLILIGGRDRGPRCLGRSGTEDRPVPIDQPDLRVLLHQRVDDRMDLAAIGTLIIGEHDDGNVMTLGSDGRRDRIVADQRTDAKDLIHLPRVAGLGDVFGICGLGMSAVLTRRAHDQYAQHQGNCAQGAKDRPFFHLSSSQGLGLQRSVPLGRFHPYGCARCCQRRRRTGWSAARAIRLLPPSARRDR